MDLQNQFPDALIDAKATPLRVEPRQEWPIFLALLLAPIVYLSVRHGIHACLYFLVLLAAYHLAKHPAHYLQAFAEPWTKRLLLAFAGLFLATAITQALNLKLYWPSFDGPSKILLAALIFLFLRVRAISFGRILEVGLPLGLLAVYVVVQVFPDTSAAWDGPYATGRFATRFVDPNSLGSQGLILTLLCLFSVGLFGKETPWLLLLKAIGVVIGIYITVHTQSRGSWLAIPPLLILWLILHFSRTTERGLVKCLVPVFLFCAALAAMALSYEYSAIVSSRGNFAYENMTDWLSGKNLDSPIGLRLSIWKISIALAQDSPWFGYGETGFKALLSNHPLNIPAYRSAIDTLANAGAHSDILAKLLAMGLIGLFAYFATMAVPWVYFWNRRGDAHAGTRAASHLGLYFIAGVFVCGLTNEMLSLKYLCSFYGLMIAGLASDVAKRVK